MIDQDRAYSISLEKISGLDPEFRDRVMDWYEECHAHELLVYVYEGQRSAARQDYLYSLGRERPGKIVTNARGGQSFHQYGRAIDWVPLIPHPRAKGMFEAGWGEKDLYAAGQAKAHAYQMRALDWETPHLEDARFKNWRELLLGQKV